MAAPTVKLSSGYSMPVVGLGTYDNFKVDFPVLISAPSLCFET